MSRTSLLLDVETSSMTFQKRARVGLGGDAETQRMRQLCIPIEHGASLLQCGNAQKEQCHVQGWSSGGSQQCESGIATRLLIGCSRCVSRQRLVRLLSDLDGHHTGGRGACARPGADGRAAAQHENEEHPIKARDCRPRGKKKFPCHPLL